MAVWQLFLQFVFRVTFGVALAMVITPPKWVSRGACRAPLWILLGLNAGGAMVIVSQGAAQGDHRLLIGLAVLLVALLAVGSVGRRGESGCKIRFCL